MDVNALWDYVVYAVQANPGLALAGGALLLLLLYRSPKLFLRLAVTAAVVGAAVYVIATVTGIGGVHARRLASDQALDRFIAEQGR